jgi:hypothetical protein
MRLVFACPLLVKNQVDEEGGWHLCIRLMGMFRVCLIIFIFFVLYERGDIPSIRLEKGLEYET